jgi:hypothetical protein
MPDMSDAKYCHKDRIQVHSVNLGAAAPHISNARSRLVASLGSLERVRFLPILVVEG